MVDLLTRQTFGFAQVDHLLGLQSGTSERWIDGYARAGRRHPPVVRQESTGDPLVTWGEFVETFFLAKYRNHGVKILRLRPAVEWLREEFNAEYPLASARIWIGDDGRDLVYKAQQYAGLRGQEQIVVPRSGDTMLPGVTGGIQWAAPAESFRLALDFDEHNVLRSLTPLAQFPSIKIDPLRNFGDPAIGSVPTEVLAELVHGGDAPDFIADQYDLSLSDVNAAVAFEDLRLAA